MWPIVPGNSIRGGLAKAAPRKTTSPAIFHGRRDSRRWFRRWVPAIWLFALFAFAGGCGINLGSPPVASSDPADLAGTWVGTLEEPDGGFYDIKVDFNSQGQMNSFIIYKPAALDVELSGTVEGLEGSNKLFKFSINENGKAGGLVADSTFSYIGIIIDGFSAGVLQKSTLADADTDKTSNNGDYLLEHIGAVSGSIAWTGNMMRVVITDGTIDRVEAFSSNVTIFSDGSFSGYDDINLNVQNTTPNGNFNVDDYVLGRYIGEWEKASDTGTNGPVVILITPDKEFLGSYSCVGTDPADRVLDKCDFHLWHKQ